MTKKALLITGQESETISTLARNLIPAGGLSLFARQMKQMKAIGVNEMHIITDWFVPDFEREIKNCTNRPETVHIHSTKTAPLKLLEHNIEGNSWYLIEEGVIIDDRIINHIDQHPSPTIISFIGHHEFLEERTAHGITLPLETEEGYFGSLARLSSATLAANVRKLNSLDALPGALMAISRANDCELVKVIDIPRYMARRQRNVDMVWMPLMRREDEHKGTAVLLEQTEMPGQDWIARYIYRHIENFTVKYLCKTPVSPNHLTILASLIGAYIIYLFWNGHIVAALFAAFGTNILYGISRKLGHLKKIAPKFDVPARLYKKIVTYGYYAAIAGYLWGFHGLVPVLLVLTLVLFHLADEIQGEFFRRMTGHPLWYAASFDRKFRLIAAGPNITLWVFLPFFYFDQWLIGLGFASGYVVITFFVHQLRLVYHLKNIMVAESETFARNFRKTKIL